MRQRRGPTRSTTGPAKAVPTTMKRLPTSIMPEMAKASAPMA